MIPVIAINRKAVPRFGTFDTNNQSIGENIAVTITKMDKTI